MELPAPEVPLEPKFQEKVQNEQELYIYIFIFILYIMCVKRCDRQNRYVM